MSSARKLQPQQIEVDAQSKDRVAPDCIGLATGLPPEQVLRLATELGYTHVVQKNGLEYDKELATTKLLIENPTNFFNFPVASVFNLSDLSPAGDKLAVNVDAHFHSSTQKQDLLSQFTNFMSTKTLPQTMIEDVNSVADEMFTNAIFNAPFVDQASLNNPGVSRQNQEVNLEPSRPGRLILASDETRIMVACEDPFGSLNLNGYLSKIKATYDQGASETMSFGTGGAGLGSYIIYNTSASLYVGVKSGRATIIACLLPLKMSNKKRSSLPKHLHWIQL